MHKPVSPEGENIRQRKGPGHDAGTNSPYGGDLGRRKEQTSGRCNRRLDGGGHYLAADLGLAKGVGCGVASGGPQNWDLLVCRYSPPGWEPWVINQAKGPMSP